jgi:hypothetical protein
MQDVPSGPPLTDEQVALLAQRYGPAHRKPVGVLIAVGVVVAALLAWLVWAGLLAATPDVRWEVTGYSDVTDRSIQITFTVTKQVHDTAICTVQARDEQNNEVGRADVPVSDALTNVEVRYTLKVIAKPTTVDVLNCVIAK